MRAPSVFNIPASADFAATLAKGVVARTGGDPLAVSSATIYLPTRRAARAFGDAFARVLGGAALLPQFRALGESEDDELLIDSLGDGLVLPPAISRTRRQLLLAKLIRQWRGAQGRALSFAQAASLAASLARVMDEVETQGADLKKLKDVVPAALAEHWQDRFRLARGAGGGRRQQSGGAPVGGIACAGGAPDGIRAGFTPWPGDRRGLHRLGSGYRRIAGRHRPAAQWCGRAARPGS
jgi:hypothetical protein